MLYPLSYGRNYLSFQLLVDFLGCWCKLMTPVLTPDTSYRGFLQNTATKAPRKSS